MIKSSVTISLVAQSAGGPFVFRNDLAEACRKAAALGFDGVEVFAPCADALDRTLLKDILGQNNLELSALGTGAGFLLNGLHLCEADIARRQSAIDFIAGFIETAAGFGAATIIGSMQGSIPDGTQRTAAEQWVRVALNDLAALAARFDVPLLLEPLNRYETNFVNRLEQGTQLISSLDNDNVKLLADLFHMNIEEGSLANAIRKNGEFIGYVHLADSNRRPAGLGHIDFGEVAGALGDIGYNGYVSAEALPWPDSAAAAKQTMKVFKKYFADT